jgi:hypothetical protein
VIAGDLLQVAEDAGELFGRPGDLLEGGAAGRPGLLAGLPDALQQGPGLLPEEVAVAAEPVYLQLQVGGVGQQAPEVVPGRTGVAGCAGDKALLPAMKS